MAFKRNLYAPALSTYISNDLYVHRTKTINADEVFTKNIGKLLNPPATDTEIELLKDTKEVIFNYTDVAYDLEIPGVGFVHLGGKNVTLKVTVFNKIEVKLLKSFI